MTKLRCAAASDVKEVANLLVRARHELNYNTHLPVDAENLLASLTTFSVSPEYFFYVLEKDAQIEGVFIGFIAPIWWSTGDITNDLLFYASPNVRGHGVRLIRSFIQWSKGFDSVKSIYCGNSVGSERAGKLYERLGFVRAGNNYVMEVSR